MGDIEGAGARLVPLLGLLLFIGVGFGWRTWLQRRRFGSSGFMLFRSGRWSVHLREAAMFTLPLVLGAQAIAYAGGAACVDALWLVRPGPIGMALGTTLLVLGTTLMAAAQLDLGVSWRIGIEEGARPGLVVGGLYRLCRNPIFLAMLVALVGYAVVLPTWLSWVAVAGSIIGVHRQVLEEEGYLLRTYGEAYAAYASTVGRFLPGIGRLPAPR